MVSDETDHTVNPDQVSKVNHNLRELYASYNWDQTFYLDLGRQIVVWGEQMELTQRITYRPVTIRV